MSKTLREAGFTQRKPTEPGVYFVRNDMPPRLNSARREREQWDVAEIIFFAGSYGNVHDNREANAHWRLQTLSGLNRAWHPGMWLKGPISPFSAATSMAGKGTTE